jgi:1-deoxy-D-xylulose-5-phosphate reductoisomerase
MKRIAILGSTGSIGQSALSVIRSFPDKFRVLGLGANSHIDILYQQIKEFRPVSVYIKDKDAICKLIPKLKNKIKLLTGKDGVEEMVRDSAVDEIILAISGSSALYPLLTAIDSSKTVALANKEALAMAGPIIMRKAQKNKAKILPIDSEQSAIWQCLNGQDKSKLKNIYLTASGGPFRLKNKADFKHVSLKKILKHPRWKMGKKITVDSATLMNKGLEVLEAMFLFNVELDKINVLIHPEAIIHSMVEFIDGVILAQLSVTDMRIPIQFALSYPERLYNKLPGVDFFKLKSLNFQKPDFDKFSCLKLAYRAAQQGGTMPCVLNAANEISVDELLKERLDFISIPKVIEGVMRKHKNTANPELGDVLEADAWARAEARKIIHKMQ